MRYEIDAERYYEEVVSLLNTFKTPDTQGLLLSTQMHGCVLTDKAFMPVTPYISWQDGLGREKLPQIAAELGTEAARPSGVPLKGNLALCALKARRLMGEQWPQGSYLCTLGGYIIGRLTGEHICHMTNAAPTGLADVRNGCWNSELIHAAGLQTLVYPRISYDLQPVGMWGNIAVYPDLGDQQVCAYGARLQPERDLHISVGTAGLIGCLHPQWGNGKYENRPWLTPQCYLRTISGLPGGRHIASLERLLKQCAMELGSGAVNDEQIWHWMCSLKGTPASPETLWDWLGMTPEQAVLSVYARMAAAFRTASDQLEASISRLAFSGGCVTKNAALQKAFQKAYACDADAAGYDVTGGLCRLAAMLSHE